MVLDVVPDPVLSDDGEAPDRSHTNKNKRVKVPKKLLKAEREKLKREQLNDHFNRLATVLELCDENSGKASILSDTIRFVNDMITQIQNLRKENATLLSESHYMITEKNELKEENSALEAHINKMQSELKERQGQSKPDLNITPPECLHAEVASHYLESHFPQLSAVDPSIQQPPIMGPLYVMPVGPDVQTFEKANTASNPPVAVRKPHARYPTPADSWPLHILSKQPETTS